MPETLIKTKLKRKWREIVARTRGSSHGPITRLVSPSDLGHALKPFVFLDYFDIDPKRMPPIGFHPHSGIDTVTVVLRGQLSYQETSGSKGVIDEGGVEWMRAGGGVWHSGGAVGSARIKGYQLWIALPPEEENSVSEARYFDASRFRTNGPARVILGSYGTVASEVRAPEDVNYLTVALRKGEKWRYQPPSGHTVAWAAVHEGELATPAIEMGELAVFEESNAAIEFEAIENTGFIIGSAVKHPYNLLLGAYSVHTSRNALERGEARIAEIGKRYPFVRS
jgi:redox-sensitive bicupin YhaK (pirin superfamily)